jgi:hypothetical protein
MQRCTLPRDSQEQVALLRVAVVTLHTVTPEPRTRTCDWHSREHSCSACAHFIVHEHRTSKERMRDCLCDVYVPPASCLCLLPSPDLLLINLIRDERRRGAVSPARRAHVCDRPLTARTRPLSARTLAYCACECVPLRTPIRMRTPMRASSRALALLAGCALAIRCEGAYHSPIGGSAGERRRSCTSTRAQMCARLYTCTY